jgi:hypothetical protein
MGSVFILLPVICESAGDQRDRHSGGYSSDNSTWSHHRAPRTRGRGTASRPCPHPHTIRGDSGDCECRTDFPWGDPHSSPGCWKCSDRCAFHGQCVYPGRCECLNFFRGDGIIECRPLLPQILAISPSTGRSDESTLIDISFVYNPSDEEWKRVRPSCRFGLLTVEACNVTNSSLRCLAPPQDPHPVDVAISFDSVYLSRDIFIFTYTTPFGLRPALFIMCVYAGIVLGIAGLFWMCRCRQSTPGISETGPFLPNRRQLAGVGFGRAGVRQRFLP